MAITSQADMRRFQKYTDQHGRRWTACVEHLTGHPCTPIQPGFLSPIIPPQNYITIDAEQPGRVFIAYDRWIVDLDNADKDWMRRCHEVGSELYKDQFDPDAQFNVAVLNRVGARPHVPKAVTPLKAKPLPGAASLPVHACQQENAWALGLKGPKGEEPRIPAILKDFFIRLTAEKPVFVNDFEPEPVEEIEKPKNKGGRPTNAAIAARQAVPAGVSEDEWANSKE